MERSIGRRTRKRVGVALAALLAAGWVAGTAVAQEEPSLAFSSPGEGVEIIGKRPVLCFAVDIPHQPDSLLVLVDGVDVTGALDRTEEGFEYRPVQLLTAGDHYLEVVVAREDGTEARGNFTFSSRHSQWFTSVYSSNEASVVYQKVLEKPEEDVYTADNQTEGNLSSTTVLQEGGWETRLVTNMRYFDSNVEVFPPQKKGIDLADYQFSTGYTGEHGRALAVAGDVQLQETPNTVSYLTRRGVRAEAGYRGLSVRGFAVRSEQLFGFDGGSGLQFDGDPLIRGATGQLDLFANTLTLRTIYVAGTAGGDSFGIYDEAGDREGNVRGVAVDAQWFSGALNLRGEYDRAEFDGDTSDELDAQRDRAWVVGANGSLSVLGYDFAYEYMGPDYEVVGNQGLQRDRRGFTTRGDLRGQTQSLGVSFARYRDNVEEDELFPQVESTQIGIDYSLNRFPSLPVTLSYQRSVLDTKLLPEFGWPSDSSTEAYSGSVSYMLGSWNLGLQVMRQTQDDRTESDADTRAVSVSFAPSYYGETLSLSPSVSFDRSKYEATGVRTDTRTANFDVQGTLFGQVLSYGLSGSATRTLSDDGFTDLETLNANGRFAGRLFEEGGGFRNPTLGLQAQYGWSKDAVYEAKTRQLTVLLVLSTGLGLSL